MHFKINKITDSVIHKQYWHFIECEDEILTHPDKCGNTIFHKLNKNEIKKIKELHPDYIFTMLNH